MVSVLAAVAAASRETVSGWRGGAYGQSIRAGSWSGLGASEGVVRRGGRSRNSFSGDMPEEGP